MAIVVEWVKSNLDAIRELDNPTWNKRIDASEKHGHPIREGLRTYPRELSIGEWVDNAVNGTRSRLDSDGYIFYTLSGLLHSIFSYFELDDDYTDGIRHLNDIASVSTAINEVNSKGIIKIPDSVYRHGTKMLLANDGLMSDVSDSMIQLTEKRKSLEAGWNISAKNVNATMNIYPDIKGLRSRTSIANLKISAFNLPHMGDDMDDVTAMAIWNR